MIPNADADEEEDEEEEEEPGKSPKPFDWIKMLKDIASVVCLILTTFLVKNPFGVSLRTQTFGPPSPLFVDSFVDDFYTGDIYAAFEEGLHFENALFMFYAPWDADCHTASRVLESVAEVYAESDLYIAAVNCWQPGGVCRKEFGTTLKDSFPILVFYPTDRKGIQYRGPINRAAILKFLAAARSPIVPIHDVEHLNELRAHRGGSAVVGYFPNMGPTNVPKNFRQFLRAAYLSLEFDPFGPPFGVIVSKPLADQIHLNPSQQVRLFAWNGTFAYPNKTIEASRLVKWMNVRTTSLLKWVNMAGRKSLRLGHRLLTGSGMSLLAFLPRNESPFYHQALGILQEVSLQYNSCVSELSPFSQNLIDRMHLLRTSGHFESRKALAACLRDPWFIKTHRHLQASCALGNITASGPINFVSPSSPFRRKRSWRFGSPQVDDSIPYLQTQNHRLRCSILAATVECSFPEDDRPEDGVSASVLGLGCTDNKTLNFYAVEAEDHRDLADRLGVRLGDAPEIVIVNTDNEVVHHMDGVFNRRNLIDFLGRFHRQPELDHKRRSFRPPNCDDAKDELCLSEISAENFNAVVMDPERHVVLLYFTPSCNFCSVAAHTFHAVRRYLSDVVTFAMVDGSKNDLPWEFTALSYPSVLFFPARDKSESRVFPSNKPLNVPNLLSFIIANLPPELRLRLSVSLCDGDCLVESRMELQRKIGKGEVEDRQQLDTYERLEELLRERQSQEEHLDDGERLRHPLKEEL